MSYTPDVSMFPYFKNDDEKDKEIAWLKLNLKVARERCDRWSNDEYNRGYKEGTDTDEVIKDFKEENERLMEENQKLKKMLDDLPNDMGDKWWCEKNECWRWKGDEIETEELKKENELLVRDIKKQLEWKELLNCEDWKDEWLDENCVIDDVGNASVKIQNYQDDMEVDMVEYFNDNKDDMMEDLKNEWLKVFDEDSICEEDDFVENVDDVGTLYDNIREYFIHSLDVDETVMHNWENDCDNDSESDEEDGSG